MEIKKISCLGPEESYSVLAARHLCPEAELVYTKAFYDAAELLKNGEVDAAVMPVENSTYGSVRSTLDILERNTELAAVKSFVLPIDNRLVLLSGVKAEDVERIYSHEQAIEQCRGYLTKHFPNARYIQTQSTAASLKMLDEHSAGIVGAHVKNEGLIMSKENIADVSCNQTQFLLVRRGKDFPPHSEHIFVCVTLAHRPGALLRFLQTIESFGLNLTKIQSRPIPPSPGEYRFFIEFEGDIASNVVQYALTALEANSRRYRILGVY